MAPTDPIPLVAFELGNSELRYIATDNRPPRISFVLGFAAVIGSAHLLYKVVPQWFGTTVEDGPLEWLNHLAYLIPKVGVMIGLLSLFKFPKYSFRIYGISWIIGILQTILYYLPQYSRVGDFAAVDFVSGEWEIVNHAIPHLFYPLMLFLLRNTRNIAD